MPKPRRKSKDNVSIPRQVLTELLGMYLPDERKHWQEADCAANHIYHSWRVVELALEKKNKKKASTTDDWIKRYTPFVNRFVNESNPHAGWGFDGKPHLFETYGPELVFVRKQEPRRIWTLIDGEDGRNWLVAGYHLVNRIGYVVTEEPWEDCTEAYRD